MKIGDIRTIYAYNYWANHRILAAAARLGPEQYTGPTGHSYGNLRNTLVHTLDAEYGWRTLWQHGTTEGFEVLTEEMLPTFAALTARWQAEETAMLAYLAQLTDADMTSPVRYTTETGHQRERLLWHSLYHVVNHGTQHRSEAAAILTGYGASPGDLDFTVFLNEWAGGAVGA